MVGLKSRKEMQVQMLWIKTTLRMVGTKEIYDSENDLMPEIKKHMAASRCADALSDSNQHVDRKLGTATFQKARDVYTVDPETIPEIHT